MPFHYSAAPHRRKHGPRGYQDYRSYKPWLRDDFQFRCVYCLCQERWFPDGDASFSVDHLQPRNTAPSLALDYDNLVYACCQCNVAKGDAVEVLNPCAQAFGRHMAVSDDGVIHGLTPQGAALIQICRLDRTKLTAFRRGVIDLHRTLGELQSPQAVALRQRFFGFPANLPELSALRPPAGNSNPEGIDDCFYRQYQLGKLPKLLG